VGKKRNDAPDGAPVLDTEPTDAASNEPTAMTPPETETPPAALAQEPRLPEATLEPAKPSAPPEPEKPSAPKPPAPVMWLVEPMEALTLHTRMGILTRGRPISVAEGSEAFSYFADRTDVRVYR
jgi:hypothetical protein